MKRSILLAAMAWLLVAGLVPEADAQVPELISYQGVLTLTDGKVVEDGMYQLRFSIWDAPAPGGTEHYSRILGVQVTDGLYNVILSNAGTGTIVGALEMGAGNSYVQVEILSGPSAPTAVTLSPRQQIASVPYALHAGDASEAGVPVGGIILWDQSSQCPTGFGEALMFRGLTIRGATEAGTDPEIPDAAELPSTCPGGPGCGGNPESYDDVIDLDEMAEHTHTVPITGAGSTTAADTDVGTSSNLVTNGINGYSGPEEHYHPFRTVLFCRRL